MRPSGIEARRVFTRYGWHPISATNYLTSSGMKMSFRYENERYSIDLYHPRRRKSLKCYIRVIDRLANERMYFSVIWCNTQITTMKEQLKMEIL